MISDYRFGQIVIDGITYTQDVIIYPNRVDSNWWRAQGHLLQESDLSEVLNETPECLVIGTGAYGLMKIPSHLIKELTADNIKVIAKPTAEACCQYNELNQKYKMIAVLHLTC
ncbi:hypothetical protein KAW50_07180 [candidate division WOR-3 bacterium]|nr:hypothetical protein [candidate division WOR-3 bacterium]